MANDETWSAKVSPEIKEELGQLIKESGLSGKEFLEQLISKHKIQLLQGNDSERSEDIQQVTYHLDKIKASFVGLVEKGIDLSFKFTESLEKESALHKSITDQQQVAIGQAREDRDRAILDRAELEKVMADITARNEELESNNRTHGITIQMQQDKLTQLNDRIESVGKLEDEVNQLNKVNQLQIKQIESLGHESENYKRQLDQAQASKETQEKDAIKATEQLVQVHRLELEKAILETEKKMLEDNQRIRDEYVSKVEALTSKNQELTEKLHQMELASSAQTKAKVKQPVVKEKTEKGEGGM